MVDCFAANKCYPCPPTFLLPISPAAQRHCWNAISILVTYGKLPGGLENAWPIMCCLIHVETGVSGSQK